MSERAPRSKRIRTRSTAANPTKAVKPRKQKDESWVIRLYVAGQTARSVAAIANLKRICETHMPGRCTIEVIDLLRNPELARDDQIVAVPTLVKKLPTPIRRIIGDLSAEEKVLRTLELTAA
jgi:circadian clock protein KaiB